MELRPVYHRLDDRIRAHVLLCWLALLVVGVAERKTGQTWLRLRVALQRLQLEEFEGADGQVWQRTELTPEQRQIFSALGIREPPKILDIRPVRQATA